MSWRFCIDSAEKRALGLCCGSMDDDSGYGDGDGYGEPNKGSGTGTCVTFGSGIRGDGWGDGYGDGHGDGDGSALTTDVGGGSSTQVWR